LFTERNLVCRSCGLSRSHQDRRLVFRFGSGPATDPFFDLPLWLQAATRHGSVWAYNVEHLQLIRRFVRAPLRERAPWYETGPKMTFIARLPAWMKRARNRTEVLRALDRMQSSLPR
jgi:hypothetical protein